MSPPVNQQPTTSNHRITNNKTYQRISASAPCPIANFSKLLHVYLTLHFISNVNMLTLHLMEGSPPLLYENYYNGLLTPLFPSLCSVSDKIDQKMKVGQKTWFFLRFFPPAHFDHQKLRQTACVPRDHGDHGTSVSDEIDQKMKVGQNTCFFLRFFLQLISTSGS